MNPEDIMQAMIASFHGEGAPLEKLIRHFGPRRRVTRTLGVIYEFQHQRS